MLRPALRPAIALDVGGTAVKSGLVAPGGRLAGSLRLAPIDSRAEAGVILEALTGIVLAHLAEAGPPGARGVGLGFPGPFDYERGVSWISGLAKYEGLYGLNVGEALRARGGLGELPIVFRNDAEAAIVGEALYGAGRPYRRLIGVTLGTGFGSAFVAAGSPVTSAPGVPPNGWLYPEPAPGGRADDVFSRRGLEARLRSAGLRAGIRSAAEAARRGDPGAGAVFEALGADLGRFLDGYARAFGAEAVLVLGRIARAFDLFGRPLAGALSVPAITGSLGHRAALLGAAEPLLRPEGAAGRP